MSEVVRKMEDNVLDVVRKMEDNVTLAGRKMEDNGVLHQSQSRTHRLAGAGTLSHWCLGNVDPGPGNVHRIKDNSAITLLQYRSM